MSNELDAIFGKHSADPAPATPASQQAERLEVYVTTNQVDTYKAVTIDIGSAMPAMPLILAQVAAAIAHYVTRPRD